MSILCLAFTSVVFADIPSTPPVVGAAFNGLLALEDWFFSWEEGAGPVPAGYPYVEVLSPPTLPQGRHFPSLKVSDTLSEPWISEGGLLGNTAAKIGDNATIAALNAHRESFLTDYDFTAMAAAGIDHVRLPIGWWAFATPPGAASRLISDPCYPEKKFVTVSAPMLESLLRQGQKAGLKFLIDMHAMPCGASDGTYNGVFPADPIFFSNSSAQALGLTVIKNMMAWYKGLPNDLIADKTVWAFTLLNEPGLGVVQGGSPGPRVGNTGIADNKPILAWLKKALNVYDEAIAPCSSGAHPLPGMTDCPLLYMNLHEVRIA
jgi:hypothetical protein